MILFITNSHVGGTLRCQASSRVGGSVLIMSNTGPTILGMGAMILGLCGDVLRLATIQVNFGRLLPCWTRLLLLLFRWQTLSWRRLHSPSENNSQLQTSRRKQGSTNRTSGIFRFIDACVWLGPGTNGPEASCFSVMDGWSFYGADCSTHVRSW
jgi:hypothetical protein